eukprot:TRINITY_DN7217_c0_g1_i2.p1 TRINITY_DN7217_c0_g1~~TRINITY_DN7217_c0_g1_i2.p1  ORF type:complete len:116 (-),score=27.92 TRINITY_DN7217_c0_g1_i2:5-352(-)
MGSATISLTKESIPILGDHQVSELEFYYANGPLLEAIEPVSPQGDLVVLGLFETEYARNGSKRGIMVGNPAIVASSYGKGKVVSFSAHPELSNYAVIPLLKGAIQWISKTEEKVT